MDIGKGPKGKWRHLSNEALKHENSFKSHWKPLSFGFSGIICRMRDESVWAGITEDGLWSHTPGAGLCVQGCSIFSLNCHIQALMIQWKWSSWKILLWLSLYPWHTNLTGGRNIKWGDYLSIAERGLRAEQIHFSVIFIMNHLTNEMTVAYASWTSIFI